MQPTQLQYIAFLIGKYTEIFVGRQPQRNPKKLLETIDTKGTHLQKNTYFDRIIAGKRHLGYRIQH